MKRWLIAALLTLGLCGAADPGMAQAPPPSPGASVLGGQTTLAVSNVSANVALPAANPPYNALTLWNAGATDLYFNLGGSSVTATTAAPSTLLKAGTYVTVWVNAAAGQTTIAAITASSTSSLVIYQATGAIQLGGAGSGSPTNPTTVSGNVGIVNGANQAAVKAASTAPSAADPAVVVAVSPNGLNANGANSGANSAAVVSNYSTQVYSGNVTSTAVAANASPTIMAPPVVYNGNTSVCYLQFFDLAQGSVTVGSTTPKFSVGIPANGGGAVPIRWSFLTAMTVAATTTRAGSTACPNGIDVNLFQD